MWQETSACYETSTPDASHAFVRDRSRTFDFCCSIFHRILHGNLPVLFHARKSAGNYRFGRQFSDRVSDSTLTGALHMEKGALITSGLFLILILSPINYPPHYKKQP